MRIIPFAAAVMFLASFEASGQFPVPISPPVPLNGNAVSDTGYDERAQVATDGQGHWVAVWTSNENLGGVLGTDEDILTARSEDNGATWTAPAALNTNAASDSGHHDHYPHLATDGKGTWLAVWQSRHSPGGGIVGDDDILMARSTDNGASWSAPAPLNTNAAGDSGNDVEPQIATDGNGVWLTVWQSDENVGGAIGTDSDILVARSLDNGLSWTPTAPLNTNAATDTGDDRIPQVTTNGQGNWTVVWASSDSLGGTIGTDSDTLVARSADNGATWSAPSALTDYAGSDSGFDEYHAIATDRSGRWIVIWNSNESLGGLIGTDSDILFSSSMDNGATWTSAQPLNANAGNDTGSEDYSHLATDGRGNWVVVWSSEENVDGAIGTEYDLLVALSTDDGVTWTSPAPFNTNASTDTGADYAPRIATDGRGHWVVVWQSNDSLGGTLGADSDVLAARFVFPDCNNNGVGDGQDIVDGTSADCDGNGIPDECEIDSDGDGRIDACDNCSAVFNAAQEDTDANGVGDACEVAQPQPAACGICGPGISPIMATAFLMIILKTGCRRRRYR